MDPVLLKCAECDDKLGSLVNLWTQVGKEYITPVAYGDDGHDGKPLDVTATGSIRFGDADTLIEGCELQDAECARPGHLPHSIVLKSVVDLRSKTEPKIQRVLKIKGESSTQGRPTQLKGNKDAQNDAPSLRSFDIIQIQADLEAQQEEIQRISTAGFQIMSSFETAIARFEKQMRQLNESIDSVRRDGQGQRDNLSSLKSEISKVEWNCQNDTVVSRLDQQLQTTDRVVTELRQAIHKSKSEVVGLRDELTATHHELQLVKGENASLKQDVEDAKQVAHEGVATSKMYASEVTSLRWEIKQLRSELANERANTPTTDNSSFSSHQLDILASNISKIGNRASQTESLQMEFELFRTRVQRLEARAVSTLSISRSDDRTSMGDYSFSSRHEQSAQSRYGGSTRQKRPSMGRDDDVGVDATPPKRMAISSDHPSVVTTSYASASKARHSSPPDIHQTESPVQRRAKAASADRSKLSRGTWKIKK